MFKVGESVVLKNSSQNKVMKIQAYNDEFIRAYWGKSEYSFAHESNFRYAEPEEIALGHRIESSNSQAISDCSLSDLSKNESQSDLSIKQDRQDLVGQVDELQKQKSLQELEINQIAHANQQWQLKCGGLQKRVDAATAKWISIISILTTTESNVPDVVYQQLDELHDALCGYELEQAIKGGGE